MLLRELRSIEDRPDLAREVRYHDTTLEVRAGESDGFTFDGIASVVDTPYTVRDLFGDFQETIVRGAFTKTLKEKSDVRFLINHDGLPLARSKSKTLTLSANPDLRAVAHLDSANPIVQGLKSAVDRRDLDQMSIGMRVHRQEWNGDYTERFIKEAELFDVSAVTFPASPTTSASMRSLDEFMQSLTDFEMDDDEIRLAIAYFESRLAPPVTDFAARDRADMDRHALLAADEPALLLV